LWNYQSGDGSVPKHQENCPEAGRDKLKVAIDSALMIEEDNQGAPIAGRSIHRPAYSSFFTRLKHITGLDRAIGFTVLARGWSVLAGALTVLLIARFLSPAEQGYYYTFASLVAIQVVFELGFSFVILQLAAHERAELQILATGEIIGNEVAHSRLASILQKSVRWYSVIAFLMAAVLVIAGFRFFAVHGQLSSPVAWRLPWICVVLAAILTFQMDPVFSFLEGCGFVAQVARMRLTQAIAGTTLAWIALTLHHGLFAPAAVITGQAVAGFVFLLSKRGILLPLLMRSTGAHVVGWRAEIWPFQWRMAVSFSCSYLIFPLMNPVLFAYRGAVEAGRMGMSLTIAGALGTVAYAWVNTKASPFGAMIARRDFAALDRVFYRAVVQSACLLLILEAVVLSAVIAVGWYSPKLASRMLPAPLFALLLFAIFLNHFLNSEALYLRAHKREPLLTLSITVALLTSASTLLAGKRWGAAGVTVGYLIFDGILFLAGATYIFLRDRRLCHI
jgi:hypothetical protein